MGNAHRPAPRIGSAAAWACRNPLRPVGVSAGWCCGEKVEETRPVVVGEKGQFFIVSIARDPVHQALSFASNASTVSTWSRSSPVSDSVPRRGSINGIFLTSLLPTSNKTEVQLAP